jgi:hypothetical protein
VPNRGWRRIVSSGEHEEARENDRGDRRRYSSGPEEQGDEKDGEHEKDEEIRDHCDGLFRVSIPFYEVLDARQPVKEAARDRRWRDPPRIEEAAGPEQPNGKIREAEFPDNGQPPCP